MGTCGQDGKALAHNFQVLHLHRVSPNVHVGWALVLEHISLVHVRVALESDQVPLENVGMLWSRVHVVDMVWGYRVVVPDHVPQVHNPFQDVTDMVNDHHRRVGVVPDIVVLLVVDMVWLVPGLETKMVSLVREFWRLSHMIPGQLGMVALVPRTEVLYNLAVDHCMDLYKEYNLMP